jgi:acetolactate synthase-1/2/3 large subunit
MDLIPYDHPFAVGKPGVVALRGANFAIQNSDLILAIGARLDNLVTAYNPSKFGRSALKVIVDVDPAELNKFPSDMKIEHAIVSDAKDFINTLLSHHELLAKRDRGDWLSLCEGWKNKYPINDGHPFPTCGPISSYQMTKVLMDEIPANTHISTGTAGLAIEVFFMAFGNKEGQRIFLNTGLGAMGYGIPTMIGSCVALARQQIVAVESDGSLMMNVQELQTINTLNLPIKLFIFNNFGYASIRNTQRNYFESRYIGTGPDSKLDFPDLLELAQVFGIEAFQIRDVKELASGVKFALNHSGPLIVDVHIKTDEALWPKSAAIPQLDGSMRSMPLEDMSPLLTRKEFIENMHVPLDPASENVSEKLIEQSKKFKES